ncbi:MAG TPA: hypothetical protein VF399_07490 [bacterium]
MSHYQYGRRKEFQVGEFLKRRKYQWSIARGSRGPIDVMAVKGRRKWAIQVKSTRKISISYARLTIDDEKKLVMSAKRKNAIPVLALVVGNSVGFFKISNRDLMLRGKLRPLQYK